MNVLIIGCGDLGVRLADVFYHHGHAVSIVDTNEDSFKNLSEDFDGITVVGMPMDMNTLRNAGVEACDAVAVVTSDDNLNITVSQIVKEFFNVNNVVARITNPSREKVFNHFGLNTVCQTKLSCDAIFSAITESGSRKQVTFGSSTVSFKLQDVDPILIGRSLDMIPVKPGEVIMGIVNEQGRVLLYDGRQKIVLNPTDKIIFNRIID